MTTEKKPLRPAVDTTVQSPTDVESLAGSGRFHILVIGVDMFAKHPLPQTGTVTVGRADDADLRINDALLSRQHAAIHVGPAGPHQFQIEDLASANGTRLRDVSLTPQERVDVSEGEAITVGQTTLIIERTVTLVARPSRLWSHGYFEGRLEEECVRTEWSGAEFAVMRLHVTGRCNAEQIRDVLGQVLRPTDVLASYGPEDYEVLLPGISTTVVRETLRQATAEFQARGARITTALAVYPRDGRTADRLIAALASQLRGSTAVTGADQPIVVADAAMQRLYKLVERIALGSINVLILGETGVGKEVVAEALHRASPRAANALLRLNCAALPETLLESELFGHERGAFTGALQTKPGLLATANGGSVFLDEIGELPLSVQVKLLRVIDAREVLAVGSREPKAIDVRFLAATNRDLEADVERGTFRQDLFFRLNGFALVVPPLRERPSEIPLLAKSFVEQGYRAAGQKQLLAISPEAMDWLIHYSWPGNIRELRNVMERACLLAPEGTITLEHLPVEKMRMSAPLSRMPLAPSPDHTPGPAADEHDPERTRLLDALAQCAGNQTQAAKLLGVSRGTLVARLEKYRIARPRKPSGVS